MSVKTVLFIGLHWKPTLIDSLLVARQGDVSRKLNLALLMVASLNHNFVDEERFDMHSLRDPQQLVVSAASIPEACMILAKTLTITY